MEGLRSSVRNNECARVNSVNEGAMKRDRAATGVGHLGLVPAKAFERLIHCKFWLNER